MKRRKVLLLLLCVALIIVTLFLLTKKEKTPIIDASLPKEETPATLPGTPVEIKKEVIREETASVVISAAYPVFTNDTLSDMMRVRALNRIDSFKVDVPTDTDRPYTLDSDYARFEYNGIITYVFTTSVDTGGAHANHMRDTVTFSAEGEVLTFEKIFKNEDSVRKVFSAYITELRNGTQYDTELWLEGLKPLKENYNRFIINADGIVFLFDPYDIAPYSEGFQDIFVPRAIFEEYLES